MKPQLCLGTAQFGLSYGITNLQGQVSEESVAEILLGAEASGICLLDTAQAYGTSEAVLGRQFSDSHHFRLVSKLPAQTQLEFNTDDLKSWDNSLMLSFEHLGVFSLDALLLHSPADLRKPGGHLLEAWLLGLRERGLVRRIGVSIYSDKDLEGVNPGLLDLVQLPLSLFDQRLLKDGTVQRLRSQGTDIHARSLYLQGLMLTPAKKWPNWVSAELRSHQYALEAIAEARGFRLIDFALGFAKSQTDIEAVVIGVCSIHELNELISVWSDVSPWSEYEWRSWSLSDFNFLDPRNWIR